MHLQRPERKIYDAMSGKHLADLLQFGSAKSLLTLPSTGYAAPGAARADVDVLGLGRGRTGGFREPTARSIRWVLYMRNVTCRLGKWSMTVRGCGICRTGDCSDPHQSISLDGCTLAWHVSWTNAATVSTIMSREQNY